MLIKLIIRFTKRMFFEEKDIPCAVAINGKYDILLSVWNVFRSQEQRQGFANKNLSVHWVGDHIAPPVKGEVAKRSFCWISFALRMMYSFLVHREWLLHSSMWFFDFYSGSKKLNCRLVWAYVENNDRLLKKAKKMNIPIVLDNPIAHMRCFYENLKPEYESMGIDFHDKLILKWVRSAESQYSMANWFNVGSNYVKKTLISNGIPAEKIIVNHTGVDTKLWSRVHANRAHNRPIMTYVCTSHLSPRKGIQYLIKAWILASLENSELIICGGGSLPWDRICDELPHNVHILGPKKHIEMAAIYQNSDVYVLPSLLEGFVRSGLEAMAAGLPMIITEETGLTDVCSHDEHGWVVPSKNVTELAERLIWCRSNPDAVRIAGEKAFRKMQGRSMEAYGDRCAAVASAIIHGKDPTTVDGLDHTYSKHAL